MSTYDVTTRYFLATCARVLRFDDVLLAHLDREESLVIPMLLEMAPNEASRLIHGG